MVHLGNSRTWLRNAGIAALSFTGSISSAVFAADAPPAHLSILVEKLAANQPAATPGDWSFVDMEHGPYAPHLLPGIFEEFKKHKNAKGQQLSVPLVRIPTEGDESYRSVVKQVLDQGAYGIVFPRVDTPEQAARAVAAMRYPQERNSKIPNPAGLRGSGPSAHRFWGISLTEYYKRADPWPLNPDGDLVAIMMIESPLGVKNARAILETPGVTTVMIGPNDLTLNLGAGRIPWGDEPGAGTNFPAVTEEAIASILKDCQAVKKICGYATVAGGEAGVAEEKRRRAQGFQFIKGSTGSIPYKRQ